MTEVFSPPRPAIVGHRGAPALAVENTLASFEAAAAAGASWVELDVRISLDHVPVVRHDPDLPDGRLVAEIEAGKLADAGVADLATILAALDPAVGVDLEVKNLPGEPDYDPDQRVVDAMAAVVAAAPVRPLLVSSFNPETILHAGEALPGVPTGWLYAGSVAPMDAAEIADEYGATVLAPHVDLPLSAADVAAWHERGLAVLVWTVNELTALTALAASGVDAVCTDHPGRAVAALGR